jgi:hypothetical protein
MKKYICVKTGMIIDEEDLQDIFRMNSFVTFNEKDYTIWVNERITRGIIKEA